MNLITVCHRNVIVNTNRCLLFFPLSSSRNQSIKEQTDLSCVVYEKENLVRHGRG